MYIILLGGLSVRNFPLIGYSVGAGIPNIGCVFRHQNPNGGPPPLAAQPVRALSRTPTTPRERGIACPFVSPRNRVFFLPRTRPC